MSTLDELMAAHTAALAAYDANNENYDQDEDAEGKAVDAARDALLEHQPVTLEEVAVKAAYMLANRTFTEWDDIDAFKLILALTPAIGENKGSGSLQAKIDAFLAAREVYLASDEDDDREAWDVYCATEHEVVIHDCTTIEEVNLKARFFLECEPAYDTIRNCSSPAEEALRPFLRSLAGEVST